ncbi:MAG: DUF4303 domain-containing protein [Planctomycetes bacterium]|nr:DUF4303 domain-containing protein [Planctomycetota bacterium]
MGGTCRVTQASPAQVAARERLRRAARAELPSALAQLRERFPDETFYVLALQTTRAHDSLGLLGSSEEDLEHAGEEARWEPREWSRRLPSLGSLSVTNEALDLLHDLARREQAAQPDLSEFWLELWRDLRESGCCEAFGRPLLTVVGPQTPTWREVAEQLNPWVPWSDD